MNRTDISASFYDLIAPSRPNEWDIEEIVDTLEALPGEQIRLLLEYVPAIWPISHSLCFGYLRNGAEQIHEIPPALLAEWVRQLLSTYERGGLRAAEAFMADVRANFLMKQEGSSTVSLAELSGRLTHYIRGVSGRPLSVGEDRTVWTDTETIYLPAELSVCATREENSALYKFLLSYQAVLLKLRVFETLENWSDSGDGEDRIMATEDDDLALRTFLFIQGLRFIREELPGLWSRSAPLIKARFLPENGSGINRVMAGYWNLIETGPPLERAGDGGCSITPGEYAGFRDAHRGELDSSLSAAQNYLIGVLNLTRTGAVIAQRREREKRRFVTMFARIMPPGGEEPKTDADEAGGANSGSGDADAAAWMISEALQRALAKKERPVMRLDNDNVVIPDELAAIARSIVEDLGSLPISYVQAATGLSGGGRTGDGPPALIDDEPGNGGADGYVYDEWDCRRNGYRRDWCTVRDEKLPAVKSDFIQRTLHKHSGLRKRLRNQFEMMRCEHRYVRRQRDGDDIDLDAVIDAMGDRRAGAVVGERLFVRLQRDTRDITVLFLIDMSNSTSGWISIFIKEALVLLCEAMEKVGDRYGIYGFSGMKRSRCKLYHIKTIDEHYDDSVQDRISALGPKDYTRMAPAIRHLITVLDASDSRTRLLITLSDGKPEDYDGYNGTYAIEDTRKALLEAQGKGIRPFCITVDKQSHDYLDHMFGTGNYIFINKIESLPAKMSHVYRILTA